MKSVVYTVIYGVLHQVDDMLEGTQNNDVMRDIWHSVSAWKFIEVCGLVEDVCDEFD